MSTEAERKALGDYLRGVREAMQLTHAEVESRNDGTALAMILRRVDWLHRGCGRGQAGEV